MSDKPKVENLQYVQNVARIARIHVEAGHLVCAGVECCSVGEVLFHHNHFYVQIQEQVGSAIMKATRALGIS